jgi:hypothetical protein
MLKYLWLENYYVNANMEAGFWGEKFQNCEVKRKTRTWELLLRSNNLFFCVCKTVCYFCGVGVGPKAVTVEDTIVTSGPLFKLF